MHHISEELFMEKYKLLDHETKRQLKTFLIEIKEDLYDCNGLKVFYGDTVTFNIIYPLLQILCKNIQTLSVGGNSDFHPVSWTPYELIIPNDILFE
jgi:hypothetical protein